MGQRRVDRRYPAQNRTRHVLGPAGRAAGPAAAGLCPRVAPTLLQVTALVVVTVVDEHGQPSSCTEWLPAEILIPVKSDPNTGRQRKF